MARADRFFRIYLTGTLIYVAMVGALGGLTLFVDDLPAPFLFAGAALTVAGVAGACFAAMQSTLTYLAAPPAYRSRVLGVLTLCIGMAPVAGLICSFSRFSLRY